MAKFQRHVAHSFLNNSVGTQGSIIISVILFHFYSMFSVFQFQKNFQGKADHFENQLLFF